MAQPYAEYRYSTAARKRALLWLIASGLFGISLVVVLVTQWAGLTLFARFVGVALLLILLLTIRAQSSRLIFRCIIWPDRLQLIAPLGNTLINWQEVHEVRRVGLLQASGERRWACALMTRTARGTARPIYVFDDQLEHAEEALRAIVQHTPQAEHVNV